MAWTRDEVSELKKITRDGLDYHNIITKEEVKELTKWEISEIRTLSSRVIIPSKLMKEIDNPKQTSLGPKTVILKKIIVSMDDLCSWLKKIARCLTYTDRTMIKVR